jgi:hypothetical protein
LTPPFCRFTRGLAPGFRFGVTFASGTPGNRIAGKQKSDAQPNSKNYEKEEVKVTLLLNKK